MSVPRDEADTTEQAGVTAVSHWLFKNSQLSVKYRVKTYCLEGHDQMPSVFVASYSMKVRPRLGKDWLQLKIDSSGLSLHAIVLEALGNIKTLQVDSDEQQAIRVSKLESNTTDVWGLIEVGDYGYEANLVNAKTFLTSYTKNVDEAEMVPLYFRFHLPGSGRTGILIVQRLGNRGAISALKKVINERFNDRREKHLLAIERFVPTSVLDSLTEGGVREMSVTAHVLPSDIADRINLGGSKKSVHKVELRVVAKPGFFLTMNAAAWLKKLEKDGTKILELPDNENEQIRVKVDYKGRERTYDLQTMDAIAPYVDITSEVKTTKKGHPTFSSMNEYCLELRDELLQQVGLEGGQ